VTTPVCALVVNFNSGDLLRKALDGLKHQAVASTVVVDNASHDNSWQDALNRDAVQLERLETNLGFAAAVNRGLSLSQELYVLLLNADVELREGYVERLAAALDADARLAGVTGTLVLPDGSIDSTGIALTTARWASDRHRGRDLHHLSRLPTAEPFGVSGAAGLFRREALEQSGGMWEELFVYWEDTELAWRLRRRGWRFAHVPEATAIHARGSDSADATFVEAANFGNRLATVARHEGVIGLLRPPSLAVSLVVLTRLAFRHPRALRTARPFRRIRNGLSTRRTDPAAHHSTALVPHPWRSWLRSQLTGHYN
jgi:N-acetylglucosaminyl-diphospho-decaprenol L-rhamnosyltransferase